MPSVRKRLFLWSRTKKALNIQRLMRINVFIVISVSRYVRLKQHEHSKEKLIGNVNSMYYYYRMAYEIVIRIAPWMIGKKR